MAVSIPAGGTWFDTLKKNFADVPVDKANDNAISTEGFLEAAESLTSLFDLLGSTAFGPVKSDMNGNVAKIRTRFLASPVDSTTLQSLVKSELATKKHTATEGLVWLNRGLDFTAKALRHNQDNPSEELATSFTEAYNGTLKKHHNFIVKGIFSVAMKATPYRNDFYKKLTGAGTTEEKAKAELERWLLALEEQVRILTEFLAKKENQW